MSKQSITTRVIMIGLGGATSSGKTTLAKHLQNCLPNSHILHQDDFVPPAEKLPKDPDFGFENWDDPEGAVEWDRMANYLAEVKKTGVLGEHLSVDSFNQNAAVPVADEIISKWKALSQKISAERQSQGQNLVWVIVDGFLLYWDERIVSTLDVKALIRVPEDVAKARREARSYYTPEGDTWRDPPQYWEKIVWPAYLKAHKHIFEDGNVVSGAPKGSELLVFESTEVEMKDMVNAVMEKVLEVSSSY
ncbi:ribosylnicotinamide kinase [Steccherinum ochraceum]|uniref:Ribosylnicotinamide kinase n=1 Tax=Steccherinum ochraceum TaxID=92696 RepID=A0A4R0RG17_9APHY|nr:ribosylnicotinamide kinase [Steccherinum ochraceum]